MNAHKLNKISKDIERMFACDTTVRSELLSKGELSEGYHPTMRKVHEENAIELEKIIEDVGFPTRNIFGSEIVEKAWLIYQHAISLPQFMLKHLPTIEQAAKNGDLSLEDYARTVDRIKYYRGEPQIYGTNFDWDKNGELSPTPIVDEWEVNKRRSEVNLPALEIAIRLQRKAARKSRELPPRDMEVKRAAELAFFQEVGWR